MHQIINETWGRLQRQQSDVEGTTWVFTICYMHKELHAKYFVITQAAGHPDPFKSCEYVFKVQTELPRHFKDRLPLGKVGLVRVSALVV